MKILKFIMFSKFILLSHLLHITLGNSVLEEEGYIQKPAPTEEDFISWMSLHDKQYKPLDYHRKFKTFVNNHFLVEKLNQIYFGKTEFRLNHFSDLSPEEFKSTILIETLSKPFVTSKEKFLPEIESESLPDSFDWRTLGAVTAVKNQGSVGTCWAFSAVENLEGQYFLKGNPLINLSVEQVVDCDGATGDCGVYGGWPYLAFEYIQSAGGIESEADYSYCSGLNKACLPCSPPGYNKTECGPAVPYCFLKDSCQAKLDESKFVKNLKVADWKRTSLNETDIALQLMKYGPFSIALNAELLQFYFGGTFDPFDSLCNPKNLNHAVLLVGWGVHQSHFFGKQPYWIVKNSWGKGWGEQGYFRIIRNKGKCGVNTQVVTSILA